MPLFLGLVLAVFAGDWPAPALVAGAALLAQARPPAPQRPSLPLTQLDRGDADATLDSPRLLSLAFAHADSRPRRPAPARPRHAVQHCLRPGDQRHLRRRDQGVTLRQALDAVLPSARPRLRRGGNLDPRVPERAPETQLFDVNYWRCSAPGTRTVGPDVGRHADDLDVGTATSFDGGHRGHPVAVVEPAACCTSIGRAGLAQVTDFPERLDRVALYLETLQQRCTRQVQSRGARPGGRARRATPRSTGAPFDQRLQSRRRRRGSRAGRRSRRRSRLRSRRRATCERCRAPDDHHTEQRAGDRARRADIRALLTLTIVPQIAADGFVQLSLSPSWSEPTGERRARGAAAPAPRVAEADTVVPGDGRHDRDDCRFSPQPRSGIPETGVAGGCSAPSATIAPSAS